MSLLARVKTLERLAKQSREGSCLACGRTPARFRCVVVLGSGQELGRCKSCDLPLDPDGDPVGHLGPDGVCRVKVIDLEEDSEMDLLDEEPLVGTKP